MATGGSAHKVDWHVEDTNSLDLVIYGSKHKDRHEIGNAVCLVDGNDLFVGRTIGDAPCGGAPRIKGYEKLYAKRESLL